MEGRKRRQRTPLIYPWPEVDNLGMPSFSQIFEALWSAVVPRLVPALELIARPSSEVSCTRYQCTLLDANGCQSARTDLLLFSVPGLFSEHYACQTADNERGTAARRGNVVAGRQQYRQLTSFDATSYRNYQQFPGGQFYMRIQDRTLRDRRLAHISPLNASR